MQSQTLYQFLCKLRESGDIIWAEAFRLIPPCYREWMAWYEYQENDKKINGVKGSRDRTLAYFLDNHAVTGGAN